VTARFQRADQPFPALGRLRCAVDQHEIGHHAKLPRAKPSTASAAARAVDPVRYGDHIGGTEMV